HGKAIRYLLKQQLRWVGIDTLAIQLACNKVVYTKLYIHSIDGFLLRVGYVLQAYKCASSTDITGPDKYL
ncbi:hypothetical protein SB861_65935, partial [Paraburkholderia sp. SIMBA_049]